MKKIILSMLCSLFGVVVVQGQSYYAEEYRKSDDKLIAKIWKSDSNGVHKSRRESYATGFDDLDRISNGTITVSISIGNQDSLKSYNLDPKTKTYDILSLDPQSRNINVNNSGVMTDNSTRKREFIGTEEIEGYLCKHYKYYTDGKNYHDAWIYEPLNLAIQREDGGVKFILRNIKQGTQSAINFEIPKDYKANTPADANTLNVINAMLKSQQNKTQQTGEKKQTESDEEKIKKALEMLGGSTKKK